MFILSGLSLVSLEVWRPPPFCTISPHSHLPLSLFSGSIAPTKVNASVFADTCHACPRMSAFLELTQVFHVHQHDSILTRYRGRVVANKHFQGSADMKKPACASNLCWPQDVGLELICDGLQCPHNLWTVIVCFPNQVEDTVGIFYRLAAILQFQRRAQACEVDSGIPQDGALLSSVAQQGLPSCQG